MPDGRRFHSSRVARLALAAFALGVAGRVKADDPDEWEREAGPDLFYVSPTDSTGTHDTHIVLRVVDHVTGEGLPDATVALVSRAAYPLTGPASPDRVAQADDDGWVRIRTDDLGWEPWWQSSLAKYIEAPGHAGLALPDAVDSGEFRLSRARVATVEVRDVLDRPLAGATIGLIGSQHYRDLPDQRVVVTGPDGRATVADVAPREGQQESEGWEGWVVHGTIEADYHQLEFPSWRPDYVQVLRHLPSHAIEGAILHADGTPAVGVPVGGAFRNRGPWTRTDQRGNFRLEGTPVSDDGYPTVIDVVADEAAPLARALSFIAPPPGFRRTLRIPTKEGAPDAPPRRAVAIVLRDAETKEAIEERVPAIAVRDDDGETLTNENEPIRFLPPGTWTVFAGGGPSPWALVRASVDVPAAGNTTTSLVVSLSRNPEMRVEFSGDPEERSVELVTAANVRKVSSEELSSGLVRVPVKGDCSFRVSYDSASHPKQWFYAPVSADGRRPDAKPFHIPSPKPVVIRATLAGPDGKSVPGWLEAELNYPLDRDPSFDPDGHARVEPDVSELADGRIDVLAIAEDPTLAPRVVTVILPRGSIEGGVVDAGRVQLEVRGDTRLTIVGADGKSLAWDELRVARKGSIRTWKREDDVDVFDPRLTPLREGDVVEVVQSTTIERYADSLRRRLEGPGPWTIRDDRPATSVSVDPCDENGKPLDAVVVIDGKAFHTKAAAGDDGTRRPFEVAGLSPGPHRLAVSAADCVTRLYRVVLKGGEHRTIQARLRARPKPVVGAR